MLAPVAKENPVILRAEPDQRRLDSPKLFRVALAGLRVARQRLEDCNATPCSMARTSDLACSVQTMRLAIAPGCSFFWRLLAHLFPIGHSQAKLREHFLMRDRLVMLEPFVGFGDGLTLGVAQGVSIGHRLLDQLAPGQACCLSAAIVFSNRAAPERSTPTEE